jgi:hypothetical protein
MKKKYFWVLPLMGAALLSVSCVIPEKFTCNVTVAKDGSYSVDAKGTLVFYTVFDEIAKNGRVSQETDAEIRSYFDGAVKEEPAVGKYEYRNNGRAYIEYFKKAGGGSPLDLSASGLPLVIKTGADGSVVITISAIDANNRERALEFSRYGYKLDGTITITSELPVISAGGQKVQSKYLLFGPKVISRTVNVNTLPAENIVIILGNQARRQ